MHNIKICVILGCESKQAGRGWCHKHYKRWQSHGDPEIITHPRIHTMNLKDRILDTIKIDGDCWIWQGSISKGNGRPRIKYKCKTITAYRASYIAFKGDIPSGIFVCHHCDNPLCVNPEHLFLGTAVDNMSDCKNKGRNVFGEAVNTSKLTIDNVLNIRKKEKTAKIYAEMYSVALSTIYRIWNDSNWSQANNRQEQKAYGA